MGVPIRAVPIRAVSHSRLVGVPIRASSRLVGVPIRAPDSWSRFVPPIRAADSCQFVPIRGESRSGLNMSKGPPVHGRGDFP